MIILLVVLLIVLIFYLKCSSCSGVSGGLNPATQDLEWYCLLDQHTQTPSLSAFEYHNILAKMTGTPKFTTKTTKSFVINQPRGDYALVKHPKEPPQYGESQDLEVELLEYPGMVFLKFWPLNQICFPKYAVRFSDLERMHELRQWGQTYLGCDPKEPCLIEEHNRVAAKIGKLNKMPKPHILKPKEFTRLTLAGKKWYICQTYDGLACHLVIMDGTAYLAHKGVISKLGVATESQDTILWGVLRPNKSYMILDVLVLNGEDLTLKGWNERRGRTLTVNAPGGLTVMTGEAVPLINLKNDTNKILSLSKGVVYASDDPLQSMALFKWFPQTSIDVMVFNGDAYGRDKSQCVKIKNLKLKGVPKMMSKTAIVEVQSGQINQKADVPFTMERIREALGLKKWPSLIKDIEHEAWLLTLSALLGRDVDIVKSSTQAIDAEPLKEFSFLNLSKHKIYYKDINGSG